MQNIKLGCAPIAWTNDDMPELGAENTFEQCISEMALAGYEGTEVGNKYPKNPDELKRYLEPLNLEVASAWFSSFLTTASYEEVEELFVKHRDFLYELGAKVIVVSEQGYSIQKEAVPLFTQKPIFNNQQWKRLTTGLERLGELADERNMKLVYHHHMGTGIQTTEEINRLMEETDPSKVSLLYDTGHLVFSGEDPLYILKSFADRIYHVHFKDIRGDVAKEVAAKEDSFFTAVRKGAFTVPGDGIIDFKPILTFLTDNQYSGWIVVEAEQDPSINNAFEYAKKARKYIEDIK